MNHCLHCALLEAANAWGTEHGTGEDDNGHFVTYGDLIMALSTCVGETLAANIHFDNAARRGGEIMRHMSIVGTAMQAVDQSDAAERCRHMNDDNFKPRH